MNARDRFIRDWIARQTEPFYAQKLADALNDKFHPRKHYRYQTVVPMLKRLEMFGIVHGEKERHKMPVTLWTGKNTYRLSVIWSWTNTNTAQASATKPDNVRSSADESVSRAIFSNQQNDVASLSEDACAVTLLQREDER